MGESLKYLHDRVSLRWYFRKVFIIWSYLFDFLKNGELQLIWILLKSTLFNRTNKKDLIVNAHFGKFYLRKNTMDFKMANKTYERRVVKTFKQELSDKDVVIDIGSNSGLYSLISAKENKKTFAFEPIKENFESLNKNLKLNNYDHIVHAYNFGLGKEEETIMFNFNPYNTGAASKYQIKLRTIEKEGVIRVFDKLDIEELDHSKNALVKLDVEGMEVSVIEGMPEFIRACKNLSMVIETKHIGIEPVKKVLSDIANFEFHKIDSFNMLAKKIN